MSDLLTLPLGPGGDLVEVRAGVRRAADLLGLGAQDQTRLATAAAEVARTACPAGGTMRLRVEPDPEPAGSLVVELAPGRHGAPQRPGGALATLGRLVDSFQEGPEQCRLVRYLPGEAAVPPARLDQVRAVLVREAAAADPTVALHEQNSELAATLVQLRNREGELVRLNRELAETNRGVLALYAELERSAEQVRVAQRMVFTELENALRPPPPVLPGVELGIRYLPAESNSPTGGDLYDWLVLPDGSLHISVVDVVGHGVLSTRTALDVTHALRTLSREGHPLGALIARADTLLSGTGSLATVLLARLDPRTGGGELAAGGHPAALLVPADGPARFLEAAGRPIGYPDAGSRGTTGFRLAAQDTVVLYTDGMIEAGGDLDEGLATLREAAARLRHEPVEGLLQGMLDTVRAGAALRDDALLLGVRRH